MDMKRFFLYFITIAALALAGCGGGGGKTPMVDAGPGPGEGLDCEAPEEPNADDTACVAPAPPGPTADEIAAETDAAATKLKAMEAEQAEDAAHGIGGTPPTDETTTYSLSISRDRDGTKVKIEDSNADFAEDDDPKFATVKDLGTANGFAGTMNLRVNSDDEDGKVEEVTIVRTDISAPTATLFGKVPGQAPNVRKDGKDVDVANRADSLTVVAATDGVSNLAKIMAADFAAPTGASSTVTHTFLPAAEDADEDAEGAQPRDAAEVMGYYNGAMGTYTCSGADDCTVKVNAKGAVTEIAGAWIFTPGPRATSDVADGDYLAYGIWLKRTTKDGETTYDEVESFTMASGIMPSDTAQAGLPSVTGSAEYTGNSTGVYVKNVYEPSTSGEQEIVSATAGLYSAVVTLMANFGGGNVADNIKFTIGGTVTDFDLEKDGRADWKVKLELADFSSRQGMGPGKEAPGSNIMNTFDGKATGDSTADEGSWSGTFYGTAGGAVDHDMDDETDAINVAPSAVLGELNAYFTDGAVLGGFGANKE